MTYKENRVTDREKLNIGTISMFTDENMPIELPKQEFDIVEDDKEIILYDKVVDRYYSYNKLAHSWKFQAGARIDIINQLTGCKF